MPDETLELEGAPPAVRAAIPAQAAEDAAPGETAGGEHAAPPPAGPSGRERWRQSFIVGFWTWLSGLALYAVVTFAAWVPFEGLVESGTPVVAIDRQIRGA
ncbi:hypothetical protein AB0M47_40975, partial [Hamadaea sp. NPDC051192]|uniref:hypothetical protein n=1 Tax=Hamadaea sp. NPDC051192 TaxID=3154940 RepID=UPI003443DE53